LIQADWKTHKLDSRSLNALVASRVCQHGSKGGVGITLTSIVMEVGIMTAACFGVRGRTGVCPRATRAPTCRTTGVGGCWRRRPILQRPALGAASAQPPTSPRHEPLGRRSPSPRPPPRSSSRRRGQGWCTSPSPLPTMRRRRRCGRGCWTPVPTHLMALRMSTAGGRGQPILLLAGPVAAAAAVTARLSVRLARSAAAPPTPAAAAAGVVALAAAVPGVVPVTTVEWTGGSEDDDGGGGSVHGRPARRHPARRSVGAGDPRVHPQRRAHARGRQRYGVAPTAPTAAMSLPRALNPPWRRRWRAVWASACRSMAWRWSTRRRRWLASSAPTWRHFWAHYRWAFSVRGRHGRGWVPRICASTHRSCGTRACGRRTHRGAPVVCGM